MNELIIIFLVTMLIVSFIPFLPEHSTMSDRDFIRGNIVLILFDIFMATFTILMKLDSLKDLINK